MKQPKIKPNTNVRVKMFKDAQHENLIPQDYVHKG